MPAVQRRPFGSTGAAVAPLGIGTLDVVADPDRAERALHRLLDAGCDLVDTAACYPGHETFLGERFAHRRDDFLLVSKCGHHEELPDGTLRSRAIAVDDVDAALRRLRTDRLDAMLLHSYDLEPLRRGDALGVLARAREQGKVRWVGYSGDGERAAWAVAHGDIDVLECSVNCVDQRNADEVLPRCRARGVAVIAKKPIAAAAWRHAGARDAAHPADRTYVDRWEALAPDPAQFGCATPAELALRFTLAVDGVHCAIASAANPAHQDANLAAAAAGPLPREAVARLRARYRYAEAADGGSWQACN